MVTESPTLSPENKTESYLKRLVKERIFPYRLLNYGRNTGLSKCIGLIGPRGSGKSLSAAAIAILDYLIPEYKVVSNMNIKWGLGFGKGYGVTYESDPLDKMELMKFDIEKNVAVLVDEVNIEFSEARRSMTNRNLIFNKILQQLRKRKLNVIYTVQHEMWIDNRLRWQTDVFIKCQDVCMKPGGIYLPYDFGEKISWKIYDMAGLFGQGSYYDTLKPMLDGWQFGGRRWWNTYDTDEIQGEDELSYGKVTIEGSEYVDKEAARWAWLGDKIKELHDMGVTEISSSDLTKHLKQAPKKIKDGLLMHGVVWNNDIAKYEIDAFDLDKMDSHTPKEKDSNIYKGELAGV